ncbi:MAG TPA: sigma-70 family RNA polymerase sigma factor, partial [Myxococcota bacterium]
MATDRELLTELYTKLGSRVYARCLYLLRDREEARDAMHDVFIKVQKNLGEFRGESSPITWITRIATNHCLNVIRAKRAAWHDKYKKEVENAPLGELVSLQESHQLLRLAMAKVEPELAEIATYYFVDEMTQQEICALVKMSAPTLRKRLREFIQIARDEIKL